MLAWVTLASVAQFVAICGAAQVLRPDYSWVGMPLSFYVIGPFGTEVRASFYALVPGLVTLGVAGYRALVPAARSAAPLLLFTVSALALCVVATATTDVPGRPPTLHGQIHVIAAATTFLCVTVAMLLQAARARLDPVWRRHWATLFIHAAVCFALLWTVAGVRKIPRGFGEKVVIVLILAWLIRAGWLLLRHANGR